MKTSQKNPAAENYIAQHLENNGKPVTDIPYESKRSLTIIGDDQNDY